MEKEKSNPIFSLNSSILSEKGERAFFWIRCFLFPCLLALFALPDPFRSLVYLILFLIFFIYSLFFWSRAWLIVLFLIPLLEMAPALLGSPKLLPHRFLLILATASLLINFLKKKYERKFIFELASAGVFLTYSLFVIANVLSSIYNLSLDAFFRSLTYCEPLLYLALTWFWIKLEKGKLVDLLKNFLLAGLWVQAVGLVEMVTQKSIRRLLNIPTATPWEYLFSENRFGLGGRISSTISHPVYAGLYFLILLILIIYLFNLLQGKRKFWLIPLGALSLLLMLATGTRAVIICFFLSGLSLALLTYRQKRVLLIIGVILLILVVFALFLFPQMYSYFEKSFKFDSKSQESANIRHRFLLTKTFLEVFKEKPVFGNGPGLIQKAALKNDPRFKSMSGIENQYAIILADGGILAGLTYLTFIISVLIAILKGRRNLSSPEFYSARPFLLASFIAYFFFIISETCLTQAPHFILMAWFGAFMASSRGFIDSGSE